MALTSKAIRFFNKNNEIESYYLYDSISDISTGQEFIEVQSDEKKYYGILTSSFDPDSENQLNFAGRGLYVVKNNFSPNGPQWINVDYQVPNFPYTRSSVYASFNKEFTVLQQCRLRIYLSTGATGSTTCGFYKNNVLQWQTSYPGSRTDYWDATPGEVLKLSVDSGQAASQTITFDVDVVNHFDNVASSACLSAVTGTS